MQWYKIFVFCINVVIVMILVQITRYPYHQQLWDNPSSQLLCLHYHIYSLIHDCSCYDSDAPKLIQLLSETTSGLEEIRQNFSMFVTKVGGYFTFLPAIYIEHQCLHSNVTSTDKKRGVFNRKRHYLPWNKTFSAYVLLPMHHILYPSQIKGKISSKPPCNCSNDWNTNVFGKGKAIVI